MLTLKEWQVCEDVMASVQTFASLIFHSFNILLSKNSMDYEIFCKSAIRRLLEKSRNEESSNEKRPTVEKKLTLLIVLGLR